MKEHTTCNPTDFIDHISRVSTSCGCKLLCLSVFCSSRQFCSSFVFVRRLEHCKNCYTNNLQNAKLDGVIDEYVISNHIPPIKPQNGKQTWFMEHFEILENITCVWNAITFSIFLGFRFHTPSHWIGITFPTRGTLERYLIDTNTPTKDECLSGTLIRKRQITFFELIIIIWDCYFCRRLKGLLIKLMSVGGKFNLRNEFQYFLYNKWNQVIDLTFGKRERNACILWCKKRLQNPLRVSPFVSTSPSFIPKL